MVNKDIVRLKHMLYCSRLGCVNFGDKILSPGNHAERDAIFLTASEREHDCQGSKDVEKNSHNLSGGSIDSATAILTFLKGKKRASLDANRMLSSAVLREFEVLGEAANKISQKTKNLFPDLPWKQLVGMRNRLIHAYFDISHDIVWKTAKEHLPSFICELENIISELQKKPLH